MKVLLASKLAYFPTLNGAAKGDRCLLEGLAARGHQCRIVMPAGAQRGEPALGGVAIRDDEIGGCWTFESNGVEYVAVVEPRRFATSLADQIRRFGPDRIVVSEDRSAVCLATAVELAASRVLYLCHSQASLPCGPEAFATDAGVTALLGRAGGVAALSQYLQDYLRRWAGVESTLLRLPVYGPGPFADRSRFDGGCATLVNPSRIKGLDVFRGLAEARPTIAFGAVPTWATRAADQRALRALPNVRLLSPSPDIDDVFAHVRVLLMPSLWGEAFGYLSVEAMLRGIPVLASAIGGLPEAKLGVDYLLPVRGIEHYESRFDERMMPDAVVPPQDLTPWLAALDRLQSDRGHYARVSAASREAAHAFVAGIDIARIEACLEGLGESAPAREAAPTMAGRTVSAERLALLNLRLRRQVQGR